MKNIFCLLSLISAYGTNCLAYQKCAGGHDQTVVRFSYGSEKEDWIKAATESFNASQAKSHDKTVCVEAIPEGSGDMVQEIVGMSDDVSAANEIDITSPASNLYLELINSQYQAAAGKNLVDAKNSLVRSQVVIAMWEPVVKSFNKPASEIGWRDVMERATKDPQFRFGQTHPNKSNSGLAALIAQFYAGAQTKHGPIRGLSLENVNDPDIQKFVSSVQQTVVHYGESTGFYAKAMLNNGPSNLSAAVLYENLVIAANHQIQEDPKYAGLPKLVAIYPSEGTMLTDHPFAFVRRKWVTDEKYDAAEIYRQYLMSPDIQVLAVKSGFKPGLNDLKLPPELIAQNWSEQYGVAGFEERNKILRSPQGNVISAIQKLWAEQLKKPSHVLVIIDRSGSMDGARLAGAKKGAHTVVDNMTPKDLFSLVIFDDTIDYYPDRKAPPLLLDGAGKPEAHSDIDNVQARGGTAMFDAVQDGYDYMCEHQKAAAAKGDPGRIYAIFVLTDGEDNRSHASLDDVIAHVGFTDAAKLAKAEREKGKSGMLSYFFGSGPEEGTCKIPIFGITYSDTKSSFAKNLSAISNATGAATQSSENPMAIEEFFRALSTFL